jgi:hypothetical protein
MPYLPDRGIQRWGFRHHNYPACVGNPRVSSAGKDVSAALAQGLLTMAPEFLTYILSFVLVCIWWVAHHHLFHVLKRSDRGLLWLNSRREAPLRA